jgi:squalene-hopene/tetraprenyl-beta-curcumene cyclase
VRALAVWQQFWKSNAKQSTSHSKQAASAARIGPALERAWQFLESQQGDDGSFNPIWFGNEHQAEDKNPVMGTAQVLAACAALQRLDTDVAQLAAAWLAAAQHSDGGWGPPRAPVDYSDPEKEVGLRSWRENDVLAKFCSVEETSAAVSALLPMAQKSAALERNVSRGLVWLTNAVEQDAQRQPAIIGFYFSRIWYYERLYPLAFAAGALSRAVGVLAPAKATETALR